MFLHLNIRIYFVVQAALQFGALSCQFLRIHRQILEPCRPCGYRNEVSHPCRAAQFPSAGAYSADASRLLPCSNLLHLYAHSESLRQHFYQLTEVHASVSYVIENGLSSVTLIFHIANFHLQTQVLRNLAAAYHSAVLARLRLLVLVQINLACLSVDAFYLNIRFQASLLHLQQHQSSRHRDCSYVVSRSCFNGHYVTLLKWQFV